MSANKAAQSTNLVFFTFIQLVYTAIVYSVVSVDPIIVDAINPILVSTPKFVIISVAIAIEALPDIGLRIARGKTSIGKLNKLTIGFVKLIIPSIIPDVLNAPIATNKHKSVGNKFITVLAPFFAPSIKISTLFLFSLAATITTIKIIKGILSEEINSI